MTKKKPAGLGKRAKNDLASLQKSGYFTVPKSRPDIMAELNAAMAQILTSNPHYNDEFKARYSAINVGSSSLTDRERDWLASCDNTVTVGYLDNLRPYSLRGKDNQMEGALSAVVSDMCARLLQLTRAVPLS